MTAEGALDATCEALRKNDPRHTQLNLDEYGAVDWKQQARKITEALESNTVLEFLALSKSLCADSALQLSHFLRSSPSLRNLAMEGKGRDTTEEFSREIESLKTSIVIESISRSSSLVMLSLRDVIFGEHCPLEGFLSSTRTLVDFSFSQKHSTMPYETAQAIGRGFAQNKSLVKLKWCTAAGLDFLEEILFGLIEHNKLKLLKLELSLTKSSSQVLRSLLHCNETLEKFKLVLFGIEEEFPAMASVLAGLAQNKGLKEVQIQSQSSETNTTLAAAWTDMLRTNTSIKILDLTDDEWEGDSGFKLSSAVAAGLVNNSTLETARLVPTTPGAPGNQFNGPVWQEMLKKNHSLKTLSLQHSFISLEGFECLARGLSCNTSLETLNLLCTAMEDLSVVALVDGLRINKTLKCLDMSHNRALSQSGRDAIGRLLGYNVLKELILYNFTDSVGASTLDSGLSENHSLEKINLGGTFVDGQGPAIFRALSKSLRGNKTLRYMDVGGNDMRLDGVCATALKLDTMSLETLILDEYDVTSCGIAALAQSMQGPCTLKKLSLVLCDLDDTGLLQLGEALTSNATLEILNVRSNNFTQNGASQFFDLLPQMKGLKAVYGLVDGLVTGLNRNNPSTTTDAVGLALVEGLRENSKLQKIFEANDTDYISRTLDSSFTPDVARGIDFYLGLNRHGRMLLTLSGDSEPPSGLWPQVLAKLSTPRDTSLLFYFLQNKPKIVKCKAVPEASRKRKASHIALLE
jgi:hypothetical protein